MQCAVCKREMTQLFLTTCCDYCDYEPAESLLYSGYICFVGMFGYEEYVFREVRDADRWKSIAAVPESVVRRVYSLSRFTWQVAIGVLNGTVLADQRYVLSPDHRYAAGAKRVFLARLEPKQDARSTPVKAPGCFFVKAP